MRLEMVDPERAGEMKYQALQGLCVVVATRFHTGKLRRAGSQGEAPYGTVVHYFPGSNHSPRAALTPRGCGQCPLRKAGLTPGLNGKEGSAAVSSD